MYLNSPVVYSTNKPNVNRTAGIISNVLITKPGKTKGHDLYLNDKFIDKVVKLGSDNPQGIKARFGHPNICSTALGTYLGRFKNFRKIDGAAVADMHLDKTSIKSPKGDLFNYVLDMAENNPDMFGASIAFKNGKSIKGPDPADNSKQVKFANIELLYATDFVDSPAATDGLFELFHEDDLASQVTLFLDEHPQIFDIISKKPEIINDFLIKYESFKSKNKSMNLKEGIDKIKSWLDDSFTSFFSDNSPETPEDTITSLKADFTDQLESIQTELQASIDDYLNQISDLTKENKALSSKLANATVEPTLKGLKADPNISIVRQKDNSFSLNAQIPSDLRKKIPKKSK